jgi:hypothetical protein
LRSNVNVLWEMIEIRDGVKACESLSMNDVLFIIDDICINWMFLNFNFIAFCNNFPNFFLLYNT